MTRFPEFHGKYGTATVFTKDSVDQESLKIIYSFLNSPVAEGVSIKIMPDFHAGKGCVIGTTAEVKDKIIPSIVGVDIGCGVIGYEIPAISEEDLPEVDQAIHQVVPAGFEISPEPAEVPEDFKKEILEVCSRTGQDPEYALRSLGTLGGGNHFIEIEKTEKGTSLLVIHTGSRNFGLKVCQFWEKQAKNSPSRREEIREEIEKLKEVYSGKELEQAVKKLVSEKSKGFLTGKAMEGYLADLDVAQRYAEFNRRLIGQRILDRIGLKPLDVIESVHNYVHFYPDGRKILRKGAIAADEGTRMIIPLNSVEGSLICVGKGNPDWNFSAPHGAGRKKSRRRAKEEISLEEYQQAVLEKGIYSSTVSSSTLDEAPQAYKDPEDIIDLIGDTCEILYKAEPKYFFKGSTEKKMVKKKVR